MGITRHYNALQGGSNELDLFFSVQKNCVYKLIIMSQEQDLPHGKSTNPQSTHIYFAQKPFFPLFRSTACKNAQRDVCLGITHKFYIKWHNHDNKYKTKDITLTNLRESKMSSST